MEFSSDATFHAGPVGGWFTDLDAALAVINSFNDENSTDYDDALQDTQTNFIAPPLGGDRLVSIFLSDGVPNENNGTGSNGIDEDDTDGNPAAGGEETDWINFLTNNNFDASYALGFGGLSDDDIGELEPIAWTGAGETADNPYDADGATALNDPNVIIVNDLSSIDGLVDALVSSVGGGDSGNVITNLTATTTDNSTYGADGPGYVSALRFDSNGDGSARRHRCCRLHVQRHCLLTQWRRVCCGRRGHLPDRLRRRDDVQLPRSAAGRTRRPTPSTSTFIDHFTYRLTDGDGDETTATALDITVTPPAPIFTVQNATVVDEGDKAVFEINLSNPGIDPIVLSLALTNGTSESADYDSINLEFSLDGVTYNPVVANQITIPVPDTQVFVRVQTNEDADFDDETFTLTATKVSGTTANNSDAGTASINDDDTPPVVSISNGTSTAALADAGSVSLAPATEGNFVYFQLSLNTPGASDITVRLATLDNDASGGGPVGGNNSGTDGDDFNTALEYSNNGGASWIAATGGTDVTFLAGQTELIVRVLTVVNDGTEGIEAFRVEIDSIIAGTATINPTTDAANGGTGATGEAHINDAPGFVVANTTDVVEGSPLLFTIGLSFASTGDVVLNLATTGTGGTPAGAGDFETTGFEYSTNGGGIWLPAAGGTQVTIPAGLTSILVRVDTAGDLVDEPDNRQVTLTATLLSGNAVVSDATGTGHIDDDDVPPNVAPVCRPRWRRSQAAAMV